MSCSISECENRKATTDCIKRTDYCFSCTHNTNNINISLWDVETGTTRRVFTCETGSVSKCGAVSMILLGSKYLLCAPQTVPFVFVWNLKKEQLQQKISCSGVLRALTCSPDQNYCVAAIEQRIIIWQYGKDATICLQKRELSPQSPANNYKFVVTEHVLTGRNPVLTGCEIGERASSTPKSHMLAVVSQHFQGVNILKFSDDGTYLLSGGDDARVLVWRFSSVISEAYSESGYVIPSVSHVTTPTKRHSSLVIHVWSDHSLPVTDIHCGSGGHRCRVVTVSLDQTCKLYELLSGQLLCSFTLSFGLTKVTMDLAEHWLFVGGVDGTISRINLFIQHSSHNQYLTIEPGTTYGSANSKPITGLVVGRWSQRLISCSGDVVKVWDISSHQVVQTLKLRGPINNMLLTSCDLSHLLQKFTGQYHSLDLNSLTIPPFLKQLYFISIRSDGENELQAHTIPVATKRIDRDATVVMQTLKQEFSEVKDIHKRLYEFLMDSVLENK